MTWQTFLSICAGSIGLASAVWFCIGSVSIKPGDIIKAADDSWHADPGTAQALIEQSAEHSAGALLLAVSFLLQIGAAQAPAATVPVLPPAVSNSLFFSLPLAIALAGFAWLCGRPIYERRKSWLERRVRGG